MAYTLNLTIVGQNKIAAAVAGGPVVTLAEIGVGSGNGALLNPASTALGAQVWRGPIIISRLNGTSYESTIVIPNTAGGWYVRELGLFDLTGNLIAYAQFPEAYKPLPSGDFAGSSITIRTTLVVTNADTVTTVNNPANPALSDMSNVPGNKRSRTVNTKADLNALIIGIDVDDGEVVDVLGYYAIGDAGKVIRARANYASSATVNNATVFQASGVGRFLTDEQPEIDVRQAGAKCDGTTNDTARVQAAFDSGAKVVRFPAGTVCEMENIVIPSGVRVVCDGGQATLRLRSAAVTKIILNTVSAKTKLAFSGLKFDLNSVASSVCLNLVDVTSCTVDRCEFGGNYGIYLLGTTNDVRVYGALFQNGNYAVVTENSSTTQGATFSGCVFRDLTGDGIAINCPTGTSRDWAISGCVFERIGNNTSAGYGVSLSGNYIENVAVTGCAFDKCDHQAFHVEDGVRRVTFSANVVTNPGYNSAQTYRAGVYIAASIAGREISDITIANNHIHGGGDMDFGIFCGPGVTQKNCKLDGNIISGFRTYGIRMGGVVRNSSVNYNIIYNGAGPGILATGVDNQYIGNRCYDDQGVKTQTYGIEINGGTDLQIYDNDLQGNLTGAILLTSLGTRPKIRGNVETASSNMTMKPNNVAAFDLGETSCGFGVPLKHSNRVTFTITGTLNDRASGLAEILACTAASSTPQLTGIVSTGREGTYITVKNASGSSFTVMHQNAGSAAANRFINHGAVDLVIPSGQSRRFYCDTNTSGWSQV